jgi:hypothetical protein
MKKKVMKKISLLTTIILLSNFLFTGCTSLSEKIVLINPGDTKDRVLSVMGPPDDRQFRGKDEAWQYGQTGAGFGYNDHRIVWFYDGRVIGVSAYKSSGTTAGGGMRQINWQDRPDHVQEYRIR